MVAIAGWTDEALAAQVTHSLAEDPDVNIDDMKVDVIDGVVYLAGVSPSLREVRKADERVAQFPGVRAVENLLAVVSAHPPTDTALREQAQSVAASVEPRVEIDVDDGVAILRGEVEHPEMVDDVIRAVEQVPGLKELRSEVTFTSLTAHEQELRPLLQEALRTAYPVPGAVRVARMRDGLVTLDGRVSTTEQRDRVLETVRAVPGVHRVESHIHIRPNKPEAEQGRHRSGAGW